MNPLTYAPRLVTALPPVQACGRTLKVYGMFSNPARAADPPDPQWLRTQAESVLGEPPGEGDHPVGFLIVHYAGDGDYLLLSQWYDANMIKHWVRGLVLDAEGHPTLEPLSQPDLVACVWELEVLKFERDAWVRTVLAQGRLDEGSLAAYLGATFSGWV